VTRDTSSDPAPGAAGAPLRRGAEGGAAPALPALRANLAPGLDTTPDKCYQHTQVAAAMSTSPERRTIYYSGVVQGVAFRWTTLRVLEGQPVTGYVRNLADGRVELVLEGEPSQTELAALRVREALARYIHHEDQQVTPATGEFRGLGIRR
jgi:acylphosphatase